MVLYLRDDSPEFSVLAAVLEPALDGAIHTVPLSGAEGSPQSTDRKMIQATYRGSSCKIVLKRCHPIYAVCLEDFSAVVFLLHLLYVTISLLITKAISFFFVFNVSVSQIPCDCAFVFINSLLFIRF